MAWQNPKTNWVAGDIPGAGDFNRIEGNTQYLKGQTDGLKNGSIKAGDAVKLSGQSPSYYAKQADIDGLKNGSVKVGLAKTAENADKLGGYTPNDIKKLTQLGYAIRIAGQTQAEDRYTDVRYYFKWRNAFAAGKKVYFEVCMVASADHLSGEKVYAQLYNFSADKVITEVGTALQKPPNIVTSPVITIPDGAIVGVRLSSGSRGFVYLYGAWLVIL